MRHLFDLDAESKVVINPDIYSIPVFKQIWDRDKSKDKTKANMDLSYIFWMTDFRSYIADITDQKEKHNEVVSLISENNNYKADELVQKAIEFYKKDLPISLGLLEDVKTAVNELRRYFRDLNLQDVDDKGKPIHNANQVMNSIKSTGDLLDNLEKLEIKVKKDMDMNNSVRGSRTKSMYED
jgi:hypothetical protein